MLIDSSFILTLVLFFIIGGGLITLGVMLAEVAKHRPVKSASDADFYIVEGETKMTATDDTFLRTHTTQTKVASSKPK